MPVEYRKFVTRDQLRAEPAVLFVFGDNVGQRGFGGQAREMRDEPNAVGIPTKWNHKKSSTSYFQDYQLPQVRWRIDAAFDRLLAHHKQGGRIVWPFDGIGTGRAELIERAPTIHQYIMQRWAELK